MEQISFSAIGTSWQIDIDQQLARYERELLFERVKRRIDIFDRAYSRFRPDSLVTEMSQKAGTFTLPPDAGPMLAVYRLMYELTDGLMTPLIGQALSDAGYDATYSLETKEMYVPPAWDDVMEWNAPTLSLRRPALLDFGAAGKGYLIDIIADVLADAGIRSFTVDAGGDMLHRDPSGKALRVGLEHPLDFQQVIGVASIANQSLCGSAGNRRAWGRFHHILNPQTLASPRDIAAIWVVAETTLLADALTTALFFVPASRLEPHVAFEYVIVRSDFSLEMSPGFPGEIFTG